MPRPAAAAPRTRSITDFDREVRHRAQWLTGLLGNNRVAELLRVNRSQPSRWGSGAEGIAPANVRTMLDLDYVITRLHGVWDPEVAAIWLESPNAHLAGSTPLDTLRRGGTVEVIRAIDAEAEGAYA